MLISPFFKRVLIAFLLTTTLPAVISCNYFSARVEKKDTRPHIIRQSFSAMGTIFTISVKAGDKKENEITKIIRAVEKEVKSVEKLMSEMDSGSDISEINKYAGEKPVRVNPEVIKLVDESIEISGATSGKFDISFAAMKGLWNFKNPHPKVPLADEIKKRVKLINYHYIKVDNVGSTVMLEKKGMRIGLGGIAKGYGIDRAARVLKNHGINDFIVYGGGDLKISGDKGGIPWTAGIKDPVKQSGYFARLPIYKNTALVTSGDYESYFMEDGKKYHHILDPLTGYPASHTTSVTVLAPSCARADAFATGLFILGSLEAMKLVEKNSDLEAVIVGSDMKVHVSSGLKDKLEINSDSEVKYGDGI